MPARDTPRGLVVAVSDSDFDRTALRPAATHALARLGGILASQPGLQVAVEGHTDSTSSEAIWSRRAVEVRNALIAAGLSANQAYSQDFGNSQPLASNATAAGRQENRRVEIVISGAPIGSLPIWDQTYDVAPR
jgi:outer membrane protein OmpA-like peptidoglycan-associated protein